MLDPIKNKVYFVTRINVKTLYESVCELELPDNTDQHILKDELIRLTGTKAVDLKLNKINLRRIVVYNGNNKPLLNYYCHCRL